MTSAVYADVTQLAEDLSAISGKTPEEITENIYADLGARTVRAARALAPKRTGKLQESINYRVEGKSLIIGPGVEYGKYMEYGTASRGEFGGSPYTILPKKSKYLVFTVNGKKVFAKKVVHPGVAPRPFMRPAAQEAMGELADKLSERGQMMITKGPNA